MEDFIEKRPTKLTESQKDTVYYKLANDVIKNNWSDSDIETGKKHPNIKKLEIICKAYHITIFDLMEQVKQLTFKKNPDSSCKTHLKTNNHEKTIIHKIRRHS